MEFSRICLLTLTLVWDSLCVSGFRHKTTTHGEIYERNSKHSLEILKHLEVRAETSLHIHAGETLTLQCGDAGPEVLSLFWQTPFGLFESCNHPNNDPVETCNGTLNISKATSSHDGLYFCICEDNNSKTILPYRINVVPLNASLKKWMRTINETEVYAETVSESLFVAAVASSVIVSFLVAFTLGAISRSYVIKCLQTIRVRIPFKKDDHGQNNLQTTAAQSQSVFFKKDGEEDTVDIGFAAQERVDVTEVIRKDEGEEETQEFRSVVSPHPKKKSRVIKLYNYDEEGNRFCHIKDSEVEDENEVRPKLRTRSLTRLNAIMKQAEALDFNSVSEGNDGQSTEPDENTDTMVSQSSDTHL